MLWTLLLLAACKPDPEPTPPNAYRASGHTPEWELIAENELLRWKRDNGKIEHTIVAERTMYDAGSTWMTTLVEKGLRIEVVHEECIDPTDNSTHEASISIKWGDDTFTGCADPR